MVFHRIFHPPTIVIRGHKMSAFEEARQILREYEKDAMADIRRAFDDAYSKLSMLEMEETVSRAPEQVQSRRDVLRTKVEQLKER
jgi:hypothetical protein